MVILKGLRTAIMIAFLVLFFAGSVIGQDALTGRDLLKAMREKKGKIDKSAYTERKAQEQEAAEPNVTEAESEAEPEVKETKSSAPIIEKQAVPEKPAAKVVRKKTTPTSVDKLLEMVPADSHYCVRVNNFDFTLSQLDQYLVGISPIPLGTQMLVRMQLAKILGSPQLIGLNMSGSFVAFGKMFEDQTVPTLNILVPVTNYKEFISGNPNCSEADGKGVSTITSQGLPPMYCKEVRGMALVSVGEQEALVQLAESISSDRAGGISKRLTAGQSKEAMLKPIWAYQNIAVQFEMLGPEASAQLEQARTMMAMSAPQGGEDGGLMAMIMNFDFEKMLDSLGSVTITVNPKPNVLNLSYNITAKQGRNLPVEFSKDSELIRELVKQIKAVEPAEMSGKMSSLVAMVPAGRKADYVGTCNLLEILKKASAMSPVPMPIPEINTPSQSGLGYALKFNADNLAVDIALPKEHLVEVAGVMMAMQQQMMMQAQLPGEPAMTSPAGIGNAGNKETSTANKFSADVTVTLEIVGVTSDEQAEVLVKRLQRMSDSRRDVQLSYGRDGNKMTAELAPVRNVKRFMRKIKFGEVTKVDGRKITIKADKDSKDKRSRKKKGSKADKDDDKPKKESIGPRRPGMRMPLYRPRI